MRGKAQSLPLSPILEEDIMKDIPPIITGGQIALIVFLSVIALALAVVALLLFVGLVRRRSFREATELEILTMGPLQKFGYRAKRFLFRVPDGAYTLVAVHIPALAKRAWKGICGIFTTLKDALVHGD